MLCNITLCKACLNRLVGRNKFVRFKSHYAVLGVTQKATQKEIRDAYIKLSKQMHPDQNRQDSKSHDKFVQINEAYEVLGKDSSRRDYDEKLRFQYPKPTANPYKASRPSNYYSSGQFYETPYHRSGFDPSNPYARRPGTGFDSDPFSDTNYDHSFYQRKRAGNQAMSRTVLLILSLLVLPYILLRFWIIHSIMSKKANVRRTLKDEKKWRSTEMQRK